MDHMSAQPISSLSGSPHNLSTSVSDPPTDPMQLCEQEAPSSVPGAALTLSSQSELEFIPYNTPKQRYMIMSSLQAPLYQDQTRSPVDIVAVVDRSGSMSGSKMRLVCQTLEFMVSQLSTTDSLGIIAYDNKVQTMLPITKLDPVGKHAAMAAVQQIRATGGTNLCGGLINGLKLINSKQPKAEVSAVLLFTDGQANSGISTKQGILDAMKRYDTIQLDEDEDFEARQRRAAKMSSRYNRPPDSNHAAVMPTPLASADSSGGGRMSSRSRRMTNRDSGVSTNPVPSPVHDVAAFYAAPVAVAESPPVQHALQVMVNNSTLDNQHITPTHQSGLTFKLPRDIIQTGAGPLGAPVAAPPPHSMGQRVSYGTFPINLATNAAPVGSPPAAPSTQPATAPAVIGTEAPADTDGPFDHLPCVVHTFGFGADHDSALLKAISDAGSGVYYYVDSAQKIGPAFADCLGGLLSVVAKEITLEVEPLNGCEIVEAHAKFKITRDGGKALINIGDMQSEESRDILVDISVPALPHPIEAFDLARMTIKYTNVITTIAEESLATASITRPAPGEVEPKSLISVDKHRNRITAAVATENAKRMADAGQLEEARTVVQTAITQIQQSVSRDDPLSKTIAQELEQALENMSHKALYVSVASASLATFSSAHRGQRSNHTTPVYRTSSRLHSRGSYEEFISEGPANGPF